MAGGTKSVEETKAPVSATDWKRLCGVVAADLLNRKRELPEVNGFAKIAKVRYETEHSETRRGLALHSVGLTEEAKKVLQQHV